MDLLGAPLAELEAVSARTAAQLEAAFGIRVVRDLLEHYPRAYRDTGAQVLLRDAVVGEQVTVVGHVVRWSVQRPRGRSRLKAIAKATVVDDAGGRVEVPFFNQEWRVRQVPEGSHVAVSGQLAAFNRTLQLKNPRLLVLEDSDPDAAPAAPDLDTDRILATYPATEKVPSSRIAGAVAEALDRLPPLPDHLPEGLRRRWGLLDLDAAVRTIHRPPSLDAVPRARERLVYDELLTLQVGLQQRRQRLEASAVGFVQGPELGGWADRLLTALPFDPTQDQRRAMTEIGEDLARPKPMHRLLQGDVGTGKTLVAAWAMLAALDAGNQAVLMAPTSVLAEQHVRTLERLLAPLGVNAPGGPRLAVLTGSTTTRQLRTLLAQLVAGEVDLLVATHAVLEDRVAFARLGLVVIDEQHRFGVEHRTALRAKGPGDRTPDVLVMTATPIPRSLALTLYGDLDVTVLRHRPRDLEVRTTVLRSDSPRRDRLYAFCRERIAAGERVYVVCPLIEDSEALAEVASAEAVHARLQRDAFPDVPVGLVHGRLPAAERDARMEAFRAGEVPVLVATTVIEVGVDVPEATVMIIEGADRFGISQLHQLRGRLHRGLDRNWCVLFADDPEGNPRLEALARSDDGFELAEVDLGLRGEGSLFDVRQSGLPDLKLAQLVRDYEVVVRSRQDARELVASDPELDGCPALRDEVARRYGDERLEALETG